ncbi:MAG: hypothetical protein MK008_00240 [Bdellovibrionales bacterium]|nr:hypothetical protein [Bdellovibrionales bacterium]
MSRELNQNLFNKTENTTSTHSKPTSRPAAAEIAPIDKTDLQIIAAQMDALKKKVHEVDSRTVTLASRMDELYKATKLKFDKTQNHFLRMEEVVKRKILEMTETLGKLSGKMTAQQFSESKVTELVDRHTQMIQKFDIKMAKLQKVINEQEMQLHNSRAALQEARKEIERLKRL